AFLQIPEAVWARLDHRHYRDYFAGRVTDRVAELRAVRERTGNDAILWCEALNLYWLGRDQEALNVLNDNRRGDLSALLRVCLLRELHGDKAPALTALNQIAVRNGDSLTWGRRQNLLLMLGESRAAAEEARKFRDSGQKPFWSPGPLGEVLLNYWAD